MEIIFNELSINPLSNDLNTAKTKANQFAETFAVCRRNGIKRLRSAVGPYEILLSEEYSLYDWLNDKTVSEVLKNFMYGVISKPFIRDEDETVLEQYVLNDFNILVGEEKFKCDGIASAHLYDTFCISLNSDSIWLEIMLEIEKTNEGLTSIHKVFNVSHKSNFVSSDLNLFISQKKPVELVESSLEVKSKRIAISDHHGKDIQLAFAKKIIKNPYVEEVKSTAWGGNRFIRKVNEDGTIEIVLTQSAKQYAFLVFTTGRNYQEVKTISSILKDKYRE